MAVNCIAKNDEQDFITQNGKEVGPRLKKSKLLWNLQQQLFHLPVQE